MSKSPNVVFRLFIVTSARFLLFLKLALGQKQAAVLGPDALTDLRQLSLAAGSKRRAGGLGGGNRWKAMLEGQCPDGQFAMIADISTRSWYFHP